MPFKRIELSPGWCLGVLALVACSAHAQEQPKPLPAMQPLPAVATLPTGARRCCEPTPWWARVFGREVPR
jgi:hypothetical protein